MALYKFSLGLLHISMETTSQERCWQARKGSKKGYIDDWGDGRFGVFGKIEYLVFNDPWRDFSGRIWSRYTEFLKACMDKLDPERFFDVVDGVTRGHSLKLFKRRWARLDVGKYKFGNRVCDEWNGLADDVVMVGSLVTFKAKLDHHLRNVWGFV